MKKPTKRTQKKARSKQPRWVESPFFPLLVGLVYAVSLIVLFREFIFSNGMLFGSDTVAASVYMKTYYLEALKHGHFPQWAPYLFGGMPFVDAFHSDILYPVSVPFYLLFSVPRALGWVLIFHIFLGGMGMYAAARTWGISRLSSALAGLNYLLAPVFVSMVLSGHTGRLFVVAWAPIAFLLLKRIWDQARLRDMGLFAIVVGLIILTPHVQMAYFSLWGFAGYSVYRLVRARVVNHRWSVRAGVGTAAAVVVALGISAVQFYPSYNYVKNYSPRAGPGLSFEKASSWSLHPEEVVNCVVPEFSGITGKEARNYWGRNAFKDRLEYCGFVVLLLALWALFRSGFRERWFFGGLGLFALVYGLGAHTPLFTLFYYVVPNVSSIRAPAMIMFLYLFAVSLLAGAGLDALMPAQGGSRKGFWRPRLLWWIAGVLVVLALLFSLYGPAVMDAYRSVVYSDMSTQTQLRMTNHLGAIARGFWLAALLSVGVALLAKIRLRRRLYWTYPVLALLIGYDVSRMDSEFIKVMDYDVILGKDPVVDFLQAQPGPFRVYSASDYLPPETLPTWATHPAFLSNYFALYGIAEMTGYHGNQLWSYSRLLGGFDHVRDGNEDLPRLLDLAGVRYVIYLRKPNHDGDPADTTLRLAFHQTGVKAYENSTVLPYARLVTCWEPRDQADTLFNRLFAPDFDYVHTVLVDSPLSFESDCDTDSAGTARITDYEAERVEIEVETSRRALLVLDDNNYPAWHAAVDEQSVPIVTVNGTFRGVEVPAGSHRVVFTYSSNRQRVGLWISVLAALLAVGAVVVGRRWDRPPTTE